MKQIIEVVQANFLLKGTRRMERITDNQPNYIDRLQVGIRSWKLMIETTTETITAIS